jgi:large conductance mechanosensitive channel
MTTMDNNMNGAANAAAQFMDFLKKFGVIGLAIGTVVGGAVKSYVDAIVLNVVDPITKYVLSLINFSPSGGIKLPAIGAATPQEIGIGALISATISFLVLMLLVYITVNVLISKFMSEKDMANVG